MNTLSRNILRFVRAPPIQYSFIPFFCEKLFSYFLYEIQRYIKNWGKSIADVRMPYIFWQHNLQSVITVFPTSQEKKCWGIKLQEIKSIYKTTASVQGGICMLKELICHKNPS